MCVTVKFHIAHLFEVQEKYKLAKESYEKLLEEEQRVCNDPLQPFQQQQLSSQLKSEIYKQLGWMHHLLDTKPSLGNSSLTGKTIAASNGLSSVPQSGTSPAIASTINSPGQVPNTNAIPGSSSQQQQLALQCLRNSIQLLPGSGQSLYLLGRCLAGLGKVHDAFLAYRNSVDKAEANADTWCSIG